MDVGSMIRPLEWIALAACVAALWISGMRQRRRLEALGKQMDEMRAENQRLERAVRSVSHELMQPLGAITNYAEMIRLHSTGDVRTYASSILEVSARTARGIRDRGPAREAKREVGKASAEKEDTATVATP